MQSPEARRNLKEILEQQIHERETQQSDCQDLSQYQRLLIQARKDNNTAPIHHRRNVTYQMPYEYDI